MLPLFPVMTLMLDAARVIEIRLWMIAAGSSMPDELVLMVTEKLEALEAAKAIMILGGSPSHIIDHYQKIVAANVTRLSPSK